MIRRALTVPLIALLGVLSASTPAEGHATCQNAIPESRSIVAGTGVPVPPGWSIVLQCRSGELAAYTDPATHQVVLYGQWRRPDSLRWAAVHELGHAHDLAYLTSDDHDAWRAARGLPAATWWSDPAMTIEEWLASPSEDLAESFAWCRLGEVQGREWWTPAGPPDAGQCVLLLSMLR